MSTQPTGEVSTTELPEISPAEVARRIREAERLRAEYIAGLLRAAGRGLARLGRAAVASGLTRPRSPASRPRADAA
jgi:hypothetical protein